MSGVVVFNYTNWAAAFPELASSVTSTQAATYFGYASINIDNSATSLIQDASQPGGVRETILYLLTAHWAALLAPINGAAASPLVGRISDASEGSVSVATEIKAEQGPSADFYLQTKYGFGAWNLLQPYYLGGFVTPGRRRYLGVGGRYVSPYNGYG